MKILVTLFALFVPSKIVHLNVGKLVLLSGLVTAFYLFTAGYHFPGGAIHYPNWSIAIVNGTKLPIDVFQRDVGFSLLYILGGFPWLHSFIGLTLILASFAVLVPLLVYWCLVRSSPTVAFYLGLVCIASLTPVTYMKFLYPDQADMFFNLLAIALLIEYLFTGRTKFLYLFTAVALAASFTRTSGNLMYPILMVTTYILVRGPIRHYMGCILIFMFCAGLYQWHRHEIFDMRNLEISKINNASYKGRQMFFGLYMQMARYGVQLSPDDGPNAKYLLDSLRKQLQPSVQESPLIKRSMINHDPEFVRTKVMQYTPDELIGKILTDPYEDYFNILSDVVPEDKFYLNLVREFAWAHPGYIISYGLGNLSRVMFSPSGIEFVAAKQDFGTFNADSVAHYGERAQNELKYYPLKFIPIIVQRVFTGLEKLWLKNVETYIKFTSILIIIAWTGSFFVATYSIFKQLVERRPNHDASAYNIFPPTIVASLLFLYSNFAVALFTNPSYRYFHITEALRLVISGFGFIYVTSAFAAYCPKWSNIFGNALMPLRERIVSEVARGDLIKQYFENRKARFIVFLILLILFLFAWWVLHMISTAWK